MVEASGSLAPSRTKPHSWTCYGLPQSCSLGAGGGREAPLPALGEGGDPIAEGCRETRLGESWSQAGPNYGHLPRSRFSGWGSEHHTPGSRGFALFEKVSPWERELQNHSSAGSVPCRGCQPSLASGRGACGEGLQGSSHQPLLKHTQPLVFRAHAHAQEGPRNSSPCGDRSPRSAYSWLTCVRPQRGTGTGPTRVGDMGHQVDLVGAEEWTGEVGDRGEAQTE